MSENAADNFFFFEVMGLHDSHRKNKTEKKIHLKSLARTYPETETDYSSPPPQLYSPLDAMRCARSSYWNLNSPHWSRPFSVCRQCTLYVVSIRFWVWRCHVTPPMWHHVLLSDRTYGRSYYRNRSWLLNRCHSNSTRICRKYSRSRTVSTILNGGIRAPEIR